MWNKLCLHILKSYWSEQYIPHSTSQLLVCGEKIKHLKIMYFYVFGDEVYQFMYLREMGWFRQYCVLTTYKKHFIMHANCPRHDKSKSNKYKSICLNKLTKIPVLDVYFTLS